MREWRFAVIPDVIKYFGEHNVMITDSHSYKNKTQIVTNQYYLLIGLWKQCHPIMLSCHIEEDIDLLRLF